MNIIIVIINILEMNEKKESYFIHVDAHGSFIGLVIFLGSCLHVPLIFNSCLPIRSN